MTFVTLRIYKFYIFGFIPEYHAEISAYRKAYSYSEDGFEISAVINKDNLEGYKLVKTYYLGFSGLSETNFMARYFPKLVENYTIDKYSVFTNNCRFFALELIKVLRPSRAEDGLTVLSRLNLMSTVIGKIGEVIAINLVRSFISNPMERINDVFKLVDFCRRGRIFETTEIYKDYILVGFCILLVICLVLRR